MNKLVNHCNLADNTVMENLIFSEVLPIISQVYGDTYDWVYIWHKMHLYYEFYKFVNWMHLIYQNDYSYLTN